MNQQDVEHFAADNSSTAQFVLEVHTMNGMLDEGQRRALADIIRRICTGLTVQLGMMLPEDTYDIKLRHVSSIRGTTNIDVGNG